MAAVGASSLLGPRKVDLQHRVSLPPEVLTALGVGPGDPVGFEIVAGEVRLVKVKWVPEPP